MNRAAFLDRDPAVVALRVYALALTALVMHIPAEAAPKAENPRAQSVTVAAALAQTWPQQVAASGVIAPWHEAIVASPANGLSIAAIQVDVGSRVKQGQVLAQLDDRSIRAEAAQGVANLNQMRASLRQALINRDRVLALKDTSAVSEQEILQAETQAELAIAQEEQARANLASLQVRLENTCVVAPDDGVVSARNATLGQVPAVGAELFRLIRQGRLEWRAEVPASQLAGIKAGQVVRVSLPDGNEASGRVRVVAPSLDPNSRLGLVYADLAAGTSSRAAMYAKGLIRTGDSGAIVIPSESVVMRDGRPFVFLVSAGRTIRTEIALGRRRGMQVEVTSGVSAGQEVVVRGAGFLTDGDAVTVSGSLKEAR